MYVALEAQKEEFFFMKNQLLGVILSFCYMVLLCVRNAQGLVTSTQCIHFNCSGASIPWKVCTPRNPEKRHQKPLKVLFICGRFAPMSGIVSLNAVGGRVFAMLSTGSFKAGKLHFRRL